MESKKIREFIIGTEKFLDALKTLIEFQENNYEKDGSQLAKDSIKIMNLNSLIALASVDLHIILKHFDSVEHLLEKRFFVRSACLIIYEAINTYHQHGKDLIDLTTNDQQLNKAISKDIKAFNNKYKIRSTRNITAAHIDKDFKAYYDIVANFDMKASRLMILEFLMILKKMMSICENFIKNRPRHESVKDLKITLKDIEAIVKQNYSS